MWTREDLVGRLKALGLLRNPGLERAFRSVRQEDFLPAPLAALAYADMPLPVRETPMAPTMPSPRCLVSALDLLEPEPDLRVLIAGGRGGFPAAVLASVVSPERIAIVEPEDDLRSMTASRLGAVGLGSVRVLAAPPDEAFDRIVLLDTRVPPPREYLPYLADPGFLIARGRGVHDLAFVKIVRNNGDSVQMTFNEAPSSILAGPRDGAVAPVDFGRLFAVEDLLVHAWESRITGHYDQHFRDVVEETFSGGPLDATTAPDPSEEGARRAFHAAYILQSAGELERAADAYERSLRLEPSAEAHTFLGWTLSFMGRYDDAIEECRRAIAVDGDFGNPYNDIGAYLIETGRLDDAIPWLERAVVAKRYCCYFYAYTNLARVYLQKGMGEKARKSLLAALKVNPGYEPARELLRRIDGRSAYFA